MPLSRTVRCGCTTSTSRSTPREPGPTTSLVALESSCCTASRFASWVPRPRRPVSPSSRSPCTSRTDTRRSRSALRAERSPTTSDTRLLNGRQSATPHGQWLGAGVKSDARGCMNSAVKGPRTGAALVAVLAWVYLLVGGPVTTASAAAGDGFISNYNVGIVINDDATLEITEHIDYTFTDMSHGIYRTIPNRYPVTGSFKPEASDKVIDSSYDRVVDIDDIEVSSPPGAPTDIEVNLQGPALV